MFLFKQKGNIWKFFWPFFYNEMTSLEKGNLKKIYCQSFM
jgi:hypothetical protein